jgi:glycosyltransferase 2 family protein
MAWLAERHPSGVDKLGGTRSSSYYSPVPRRATSRARQTRGGLGARPVRLAGLGDCLPRGCDTGGRDRVPATAVARLRRSERAPPKPLMKIPFRKIVAVLLVGVLLYAAVVLYTGYQQLARSLQGFEGTAFIAALGLSSFNYLLRFFKWEFYLKWLGITGIGKLDSLLIFLSGFVLTVTPGKIGEVFKSAVLARTHGIAAERTAPIIVAERLTDVIAVVLLILWGSAQFDGGLVWALCGTAAVAVGLVAILWSAPVQFVFRRLEEGAVRGFMPKLRRAYEQLQRLATPRALFVPTFLSLLGWGCEGVALWLLLRGFHANVGCAQATFFYATATLAGALIPVPGGLGVAEALIQQQLVRVAQVEHGAATASMLMIRFATLWWAVAVGFVALGLLRLRFPARLGGGNSAAN